MSDPTPLQAWALPRLQPILSFPLPEEDLLGAISYAASLSSAEEVVEHFKVPPSYLLVASAKPL